MSSERREELPLAAAVTHLLEECRMVLPGLQALFGFQLIAVFNAGFADKLSVAEQRIHLLALGMATVAIALVMAPAAYHRQMGPLQVIDGFIRFTGRLLLWAMVPLMLSIVSFSRAPRSPCFSPSILRACSQAFGLFCLAS